MSSYNSAASSSQFIEANDDDCDNDDSLLTSKLTKSLSLRFQECDGLGTSYQTEKPKGQGVTDSTTNSRRETDVPLLWQDDTIDTNTTHKAGYRIRFEIISAKTIKPTSSRQKYVCYTILVKRSPGLETQPGLIERRYSDFLNLYKALRRKFPDLLNDFPFPKKTLTGNFTPEVITERSVAFQHLLAYCLSINELKQTKPFNDFLYSRELREVRRHMKSAQFEDASNILENTYFIQEKLTLQSGGFSPQLFQTACILIACLHAADNVNEAKKYTEKALEMISTSDALKFALNSNELTVPLITLSMSRGSLDLEKTHLERMLNDIKESGVNMDKQPPLLELVMKKDLSTY